MKRIITVLNAIFFANIIFAQISGNINYQKKVRYPDNNIRLNFSSRPEFYVTAKGLANVKADTYVAIFNVTQVGKTTKEVNGLMDERINQALSELKSTNKVETYVDMISFVPVYDYEAERKVFSKKTYNEIPIGFELKKNIHVKYTDPNLLNGIIASLSDAEIYDLVRVDYFSDSLETIKKELMMKARTILQDKVKNAEDILNVDFNNYEKQMVDGFKITLPTEMYQSYQAYSNSSLNLKRRANVKGAVKSNTLYYQPVLDKEFDFVINPVIIEPVIQVMYEVALKIEKNETIKTVDKVKSEYILVTPNGDLKPIASR